MLVFAQRFVEEGGPGLTTEAIDAAVHSEIIASGAYPSPLQYMQFPKSICTSVNNVVVHGIPDDRPLQVRDVVTWCSDRHKPQVIIRLLLKAPI